jgi:methylmalonyl-CoA mutase N-terminal domain/subunit
MAEDQFWDALAEEEKEYNLRAETMGERKEIFRSASGIPIRRIYTPLDWNAKDYREKLGFPGRYPYTGGFTKRCTAAGSGPCDRKAVLVWRKMGTRDSSF